ncbi:MAG: dihydroorotase family protein [Thermofilum sp.]|nr:dihydroorotase family protein [Thermofilum sp.]
MHEEPGFFILGKAYITGRIVNAAIGIAGEKIVSLTSPGNIPPSVQRREYGDGFLVVPGMVDIHVHMREPGLEYKEDWRTGSMAAVKGGVTFVADMPNNKPPANNCNILREKLERAKRKSIVDYAFYAGFNTRLEELSGCRELYIGGKIYPEDLYNPNVEEFARLIASQNKILVVHAEDPSLLKPNAEIPHSLARPPEAERSAVKKALELALQTGARTHITHVSLADSIIEVLKAKLAGYTVTLDTAPHYFLLNNSLYSASRKNIAKVNPPLRSEEDRQTLYSAVSKMLVDAIVTDHAPHSLEEKLGENPPPGFPGLEVALHLLLREILEGRMPIQVLDLYSLRSASLLGINKGCISIGCDADLVVLRKESWEIRPDEFVSKAKYSPFEGAVLRTKTHTVFLRGRIAYEEGEFYEGVRGKFYPLEGSTSSETLQVR